MKLTEDVEFEDFTQNFNAQEKEYVQKVFPEAISCSEKKLYMIIPLHDLYNVTIHRDFSNSIENFNKENSPIKQLLTSKTFKCKLDFENLCYFEDIAKILNNNWEYYINCVIVSEINDKQDIYYNFSNESTVTQLISVLSKMKFVDIRIYDTLVSEAIDFICAILSLSLKLIAHDIQIKYRINLIINQIWRWKFEVLIQ